MITAKLQRFSQDIVTFGKLNLEIEGQPTIYTIERPWLNNQRDISCIPQGIYNFAPFKSIIKGNVWKTIYVPNRDNIEIHAGNYASPVMDLNGIFHEPETEGCILVGFGINEKVPMLLESLKALNYLRKTIGRNGFVLEVLN